MTRTRDITAAITALAPGVVAADPLLRNTSQAERIAFRCAAGAVVLAGSW